LGFHARGFNDLRGRNMALDRDSRRAKTPNERGQEAGAHQRRLKEEAAERRKKAAEEKGARPSGPQRPRTPPR
jgi:uncharacterized protein YdaU (DUF1376 family)